MKKLFAAACLVVSAFSLAAQQPSASEPASSADDYVRSEVMIPMRDGAKLHTIILRPPNSEAAGPALPFLLTRTPYGVADYTARTVKGGKPELAASGYIFVYQDIRGRYAS
jgi:predicted acyl esterase